MEWVKRRISSSTSRSAPIVRDTGTISMSEGNLWNEVIGIEILHLVCAESLAEGVGDIRESPEPHGNRPHVVHEDVEVDCW
jgi:hypothetical protein